MKKQLLILSLSMLLTGFCFGQTQPVDFESAGNGAGWTWNVFENSTNPALEFVANPDPSGINTSATVAKFSALQAGQPWAGCESQHGAIGTFNLTAANSIVKIMVYKTVLSDVGIKFSKSDGWSMGEIKVPNTVINAWQELTFDFTAQIQDGYDQIIVFPDFNARTSDDVIYFDNITFSAGGTPAGPTTAAPTPAVNSADVISIFSGAYTDLAGTELNPGWGQATVTTQVSIDGNNTLKMVGLNYQGIQYTATDVSGMKFLHLDYWSDNSTLLKFFLISQNPTIDIAFYTLTVPTSGWSSVDIPLSSYAPPVDLTKVFQFKFEGNGTIYVDNIYFYKESITGVKQLNPSNNLSVYPNPAENDLYFTSKTTLSKVAIYNTVGTQVKEYGNVLKSVNVSDLKTGVYIIRLTDTNGKTVTSKFIKK